ncbi:MAG: hypothetical protein OHK0040_02330 [bacterium]
MRNGIFILLILIVMPAYAFADTYLIYRMEKPDPDKQFYTVETKHFSIHYHNGLEDWVKKLTSVVEAVHERLVQEFDYSPKEKTQVVVIDNNDIVNGYSIVFPYNTIFLNVGFPDLETTIGEYDDFVYNLFVHEYAHILSMDVSSGYSDKLRKIFGKPIPAETPTSGLFFLLLSPPNIFMPRWWHEGIATELEEDYGYGGRGRKSFYEMIFRMAVYEDNLPSIDKINGDIPYWTKGHTPYIYGYNLFSYLKEKYQLKYSLLTKRHSERFPYFINAVPKEFFGGKDYEIVYEESLKWLIERQRENIERLKTSKLKEGEKISFPYEIIKNPRFSKDGSKLTFRIDDPDEGNAVIIAELASRKVLAKIATKKGRGSLAFSNDGKKLYFTKIERKKQAGYFQNLYQYDIETKKTKKLIDWLRIKDFDLSPDGESLAVIFVENGKEGIAKIAMSGLEKKEVETLVALENVRLGQVRWSNDKRFLLFSKKEGKASSIVLYDIERNEQKTVLSRENVLEYPVFSPDNNAVYYLSDVSGVFNIYSLNISDGTIKPITNLMGGALHFDVKENGEIIYSSYNSRGFELRDIKPEEINLTEIPMLTREKVEKRSAELKEEGLKPKRYNPLGTVSPKFFIPNILADHRGGVLGVFTAGQDAIGYHTYTLELDKGLVSSENYYSFNYLNNAFAPTIKLSLYSQPLLYSNFGNFIDLWEKSSVFHVEAVVPYKKLFFKLGYEYENKEPLNSYAKLLRGYFFSGDVSSLLFGFDLFSARKYPNSISYEDGRTLSLLGKVSSTFLGGDLSKTEYYLFYDEYIDLEATKGIKHDVFHLNLNAGLSTGRETAQGAFQLGGFPTPFLTFPLRGYAPRFETGKYIYTGSLEYRFPVTSFYKGRGTTPIFYEKLSVNAFLDFGNIWGYGKSFSDDIKTGIGYELKLDITLGYWLKVTPALGIAKGLSKEGEKQLYFTIYSNF